VWTPLERILLSAVDEMIDAHGVSDTTWAGLEGHFGPGEIFELLFLVGGYLCLATVLNSIGLQSPMPAGPDDGSAGAGGGVAPSSSGSG
jgi:hypothetical protein